MLSHLDIDKLDMLLYPYLLVCNTEIEESLKPHVPAGYKLIPLEYIPKDKVFVIDRKELELENKKFFKGVN